MRRRGVQAAILGFLLAACAQTLVPTDEKRLITNRYTVQPDIEWSRSRIPPHEIWTVDGASLEAIYFSEGVADGKPLLHQPFGSKVEYPEFRLGMSETDLMDLFVDTLVRNGAGHAEPSGLRPFAFGQRTGFRFEVDYLTAEGLEMRATVAGIVFEERLYLIHFHAARQHYWHHYIEHVEHVLESIDLVRVVRSEPRP